jgi:hypothetical protein
MKKYIMIYFLLIFSCVKKKVIKETDIVGYWELEKSYLDQINYPSIIFKSGGNAIFTSRGDTIYRYKYSLSSDTLTMVDINSLVYKTKIIKLDSSVLIFSSLLTNTDKQVYQRHSP